MTPIPWQVIEPLVTIHPWSLESIGPHLTASGLYMSACASAAIQVASASLQVPFTLTKQVTFTTAFWYNGATVTYNIDVGAYDLGGNLLCHTGNIASTGTSVLQTNALTASTKMGPGTFWLSISASNTSQTLFALAAAAANMLGAYGCSYITSNNPLATGKTFVTISGTSWTRIPIFGLSTRSTI